MTSTIPIKSISQLASQVTSLSQHYQSANSVFATATNSVTSKSLYHELLQISASLAVQRDKLLIATATDSSIIASATLQLPVLESSLTEILNDNSPYSGLVPNLGFNITMCVIFAILTIFHTFGFLYRQWWFSIAFLCACILELLGYIGRVWSHSDLENINPFLLQFICLTIAPVFTMGGMYYQMAKLAVVYGEHYSRWTPIIYSYIFIACDIISLVIQAIGGGMAGVAVSDFDSTTQGTHVFVGGLALQVASMSIFLILWFDFMYAIYKRAAKDAIEKNCEVDELYNPQYQNLRKRAMFKYFNLAITIAVLFVYIRCIYRVCELAEGWTGNLILHEKYFIALDAVMISAANIVMVPFFPGFILDGRNTSIPIKKTHKAIKANNRQNQNQDQDQDHQKEDEEYENSI